MANDNQPKFGQIEGDGKGKEYPVAASQAFARRGGKFVYLDSAGAVTIVGACGTSFKGWAVTPKDAAATNFWTSSATAKADSLFVISGLDNIYEIPYYTSGSASVDASVMSAALGIYMDSGVQKAQDDCTAASECLIPVDFNKKENTVLVKIDPDCIK